MKIHSTIHQIDPIQWQQLIKSSENASFFQTPDCYEFYSSLSFLKPFVFGVSENEKLMAIICGYIIADGNLIKQFFSRRAIVPGGLLLDENIKPHALQKLLEYSIHSLKRQTIYFEIRNYNDYSAFRSTFEKSGFSYNTHLNFHVATLDVESALMQLNTTKRRDVKLSIKEGAEWMETKDTQDLKDYFILLKQLYEIKIKTPLFPYSFFERLLQFDNGKFFVVKHKGRIIGGSVCVMLPQKAVYEWFVCGMDGQIKNVFPSTLATWAGIEYAAKNGFDRFDMMGAGNPDESYGVREFKSKFGGKLVEHGRFLYICKPMLFSLGKYMLMKLKARK